MHKDAEGLQSDWHLT